MWYCVLKHFLDIPEMYPKRPVKYLVLIDWLIIIDYCTLQEANLGALYSWKFIFMTYDWLYEFVTKDA